MEPDRLRLVLWLALGGGLGGRDRHAEALTEVERADVPRRTLFQKHRRPATGSVEPAAVAGLFGLGRGAEARPRAAAAFDACPAAVGSDHRRIGKAEALRSRKTYGPTGAWPTATR
ncbi:hypothetical protein [Streptomyces sp. NPDC001568]|uniref:hypothetical protein n=1 Tax=Streptomyces sp. NPDC001568 TaxID=3364588 RepID=UPI0036CAF5D0